MSAAAHVAEGTGPSVTSCDLVVVGGGILGLATARELQQRHPEWRIVVLEREDALARHQTGRNSGVAHAGIYYAPGSLKARLCVEGLGRLYEFCDETGVPYERCGKVIVALSEEELPRLDELERRGRANGVPGLRRLDGAGLRELEPHAAGVAALHSPATGIVDFAAVARALAARLEGDGAAIVTGCAVSRLRSEGRAVLVEHAHGELRAGHAVACAGLWSDRLAVAAGAARDPKIVPFRGGYLRLRPERRGLVRSLIYPVPDPALPFLGVHLTKRLDGEVLLGPTALTDAGGLALAGHVADDAPLLARGRARAAARRGPARVRRRLRPLCPGARARRRHRRPGGRARAGRRPRRHPDRRLRLQRGAGHAARPQRAVAGGDVGVRDRAADRGPRGGTPHLARIGPVSTQHAAKAPIRTAFADCSRQR